MVRLQWRDAANHWQDRATVQWRWCNAAMMRRYGSDETMLCRGIVIASTYHRHRVIALSIFFHMRCCKKNGDRVTL